MSAGPAIAHAEHHVEKRAPLVARMVHVRQSEDQAEHRDVRLLERLLEGIRAI